MSETTPTTNAHAARPAPPLKYVGGDLALDLVNTADWTSRGVANERLLDYDRLVKWAVGAGVVPSARAAGLRRAAAARPDEATRACAAARELRAILQRLFASVAGGRRDEAAWTDFGGRLDEALRRLTLAPEPRRATGGSVARWFWRDTDERLDWLLWPVVRSAADLLASNEARRIRICDGPDCGWLFVDRSRNRLRRWCEMDTCGTTAKTLRRRRRNRAAGG